MLGPFRPSLLRSLHTSPTALFAPTGMTSSGLLHKRPTNLSASRKASLRKRMYLVDSVIKAVAESGVRCKPVEEALALPKTEDMAPRDKYTTFSRKHKGYRKGIHLVPKWTRLTLRTNPKGF